MLASVFTDGVSIYAFYAMQPYLLQLYGDPKAYGVAGLAAAIVGGAQIGGGLLVPHLRRALRRRTTVLLTSAVLSTAILALIGAMPNFWIATTLLVLWGLIFATVAAGASGVCQRIDSIRAARNGAFVRLADGFERRSREPADPR